MNIEDVHSHIHRITNHIPLEQRTAETQVTVACLDAEYAIDCIQAEIRDGMLRVVIRIEPDGEL